MSQLTNNHHHPMWGLLRLAILAVILYLTANDFDETEILTLLFFSGGEAGTETAQRLLGRSNG